MAERKEEGTGKQQEEGTGKHPHKSSEEPYPHHEAPTTGAKEGSHGKEEGERSRHAAAGAGSSSGREEHRSGERSESSDLKEREYRDAQGNVHHHTRTSEEQHDKNKK